jgi:tetratricopeptide (TPR) repeat protein
VVFAQRRPDEAERILAEAVERGGPSFELLWRLGQARDALGRPDEALALWERAARIVSGPRGGDLWHDLAARYEQAGQAEKARPLAARAQLAAGLAALEAGKPDEAAKALERAVEVDPRLANAWFALGEAHRLAGRSGDARAAYDRCLQVNPDHGRAIRGLRLLGG